MQCNSINRRRIAGRASLVLAWSAILLLAGAVPAPAKWQTIVSGKSFKSTAAFQASWNYNYPWGADHNGSARMNQTNVTVAGGVVTLTSTLTNFYEGRSRSSPHRTIRYNSGTFYLKQPITISPQYPVWDISGRFKVPTQKGCWPAFWLTGVNSWPPESDFMEFKGGTGCNQNTYNGAWQGRITPVPTASSAWHTYRLAATLANSTNVDFRYYIDGIMETEQTATTFVGAPCWLIIDYQMEGSSGSPGPNYTTYAYVSDIVVKRENAPVSGAAVPKGASRIRAQTPGDSVAVLNQNPGLDLPGPVGP